MNTHFLIVLIVFNKFAVVWFINFNRKVANLNSKQICLSTNHFHRHRQLKRRGQLYEIYPYMDSNFVIIMTCITKLLY